MQNIGMIVAIEIDAVLNKYGKPTIVKYIGFEVYQYRVEDKNLFVIHSGAGEIEATMATQFLISQLQAELIVNFGVVGGLTEEMKLARTCIAKSVVHYDFDTSEADNSEVGRYLKYQSIYIPTTKEVLNKALEIYPDLKVVVCASGDKFMGSEEKKRELHNKFNADICEMEAAGIVLTCNRNKVPCLLIKTVSDSILGGAEEFFSAVNESAKICMEITHKIISSL